MRMRFAIALVLAAASGTASAQPSCPDRVEVRVDAALLPDGRAVTVQARWMTDWRGVVSDARVDSVVTGSDRPRGEMHPQLRRAIQNAIEEQAQCAPHPQGPSAATYPFLRNVTVRPGA